MQPPLLHRALGLHLRLAHLALLVLDRDLGGELVLLDGALLLDRGVAARIVASSARRSSASRASASSARAVSGFGLIASTDSPSTSTPSASIIGWRLQLVR